MAGSPIAPHLISSAVLCRRCDKSIGERRSTREYRSGTWLKTAFVMAARLAVRVKGSYQWAQVLGLKIRRDPRKAIRAVDLSILGATHHMLRDRAEYSYLGADHFSLSDRSKAVRRLVH